MTDQLEQCAHVYPTGYLRLAALGAGILALVAVLAVILVVLGHGSSGSSAGNTTQIHGQVAIVGAVQTDISAGTQITILAPSGQVLGSATLVYQGSSPAEAETSYTWNATVPAENTYGVELSGTTTVWRSAQQAQAGIVTCTGPGCTP